MSKNFLIFQVLAFVQIILFIKACDIGCISCDINSKTGLNTCLQCEKNYQLDIKKNICVYSSCPRLTYLELDDINSNRSSCVPLCQEQNEQNLSQNICNEAIQCSTQYVQPSSTNKGRSIKSIFVSNTTDQIFLIYDQFINAINLENGYFMRSYTFDSNIFSVYQYKQNIFLYGDNKNSVFLWNPRDNSLSQVLEIGNGTLKVISQIMEVANNQNILLITSIDDAKKIMYFTQFNTTNFNNVPPSLFQISVQDNSNIYLFEQIIVQQAQNWQIIIYEVIEKNSQLSLIQITQNYVCSNAQGTVKFVSKHPIDESIIIYFQNTAGIYKITKDNVSCNQIMFHTIASQIKQLDFQFNHNYFNLIFLSLDEASIQIFDLKSQQSILLIQLNYSVIDFQSFITQQSQDIVLFQTFVLTKNGLVESISIQIKQTQNNDLTSVILQKSSIQSLIQNPQNLFLANQFPDQYGNLQQLSLIFLVYQDAQIIKISDLTTLGLAQDYQDKQFYNRNTINAITYSPQSQLIVSCDSDGKVIVWQAVDLSQPIFLYQLIQQGQQCVEVLIYQANTLIVQFQNQIQLLNIYNYLDQSILPIQQSEFTRVQLDDYYFFILTGNKLFIYKQKEQIYYQGLIEKSSQPTYLVQFFVSTGYRLIFVDNMNTVFQYVFTDNSPINFSFNTQVTPFISAFKIVVAIFLPQQNGSQGDMIILNDDNKNIVILDKNLTVLANQNYNYGQISKARIIDNYFLFLVKVFNPQSVYAYATVAFDVMQKKFFFIGTNLLIQDMPLVYKQIQQDGSLQYSYVLTNPIGYTSYTLRIYWNPLTSSAQFDNFNYTPGQNIVSSYGNSEKNLVIAGSQTGQVRLIVFDKNITPQQIYTPSSESDNIQIIQNSFKIGMFFIVTNYQIKCFSIHTQKLLEVISFNTLKTPQVQPTILNLVISDNLKILIAYTQKEIILKNFINNKLYSVELMNNSNIYLTLVNGVYIDEVSQQIYIYGSDILVIDSYFDTKQKLTTLNSNQQYNQCIFTATSVYCSMNQIQLHIFNLYPSFTIQSVAYIQPALAGFQFIIDQDYQQIILYKQLIDLYSIQGVFIQTINTVTANIIYLKQTTNNIVVFTQSSNYFFDCYFSLIPKNQRITQNFDTSLIYKYYVHFFIQKFYKIDGYIFSRGNLVTQGSIQPAGGFILGVFYIESLNQIAFFTNQILFGQVLFYNLNNQQSAGFISNTYTQNGIGRTVQVSFDNDSVMLNYLDNYGNFQNVIFSTSKTTDNQIIIPQMLNGYVSQPKGYLLDFDQNSVYIYGSDSLFKINYNLLTRPMQRIIRNEQQLQFTLKKDVEGQTVNMVYLVDYQNNLFSYNNYQVIFQTRYNDEIIDIFSYSDQSNQMVIVCSLNYILAFKNTNNFKPQNKFLNITNYKYRKLLLNSQGRIVFNTLSNEIVDFDFLNNQQNSYLKLDASDLIICSLQINKTILQKWYFFLGTQKGNIIQYDVINKQMKIVTFESLPVTSIIQITSDQINLAITYNSGSIFEINSQSLKLNSDQRIQLNRQMQTEDGGNQNKQVSLFLIDLEYQNYFINLEHEKQLGIYSLNDHSFQKYISFPDNEYKKIIQNQSFLVLASSAQLNVFDKKLNYINRLRRYNRKDRISDILLIDQDKIIIVFTTRIEFAFIDTTQMLIRLIDQVLINDSRLIFSEVLISQNVIHLIGISQTNIFEKKISLGLFYENNLNQQNQKNQCSSSLSFTDSSSVQNQLDYILSTSVKNIKFILSILVGNQLRQMKFLQNSSAQIIIRPIDKKNNVLKIDSNIFQLLPFNVNMDNFKFDITSENIGITFHKLTQNITLQNIDISNQTIPSKTSFIFQNMDSVLIENLNIQNIIMKQQQQSSDQPNQNTQSFLYFDQCQYIYISQLNLVNVSLSDPLQFLLNIQNSNQVLIQNVNIIDSKLKGNLFIFKQLKNVTFSKVTLIGCSQYFDKSQQIQDRFLTASSSQILNKYIFTFIGIINLQIYDYLSQNNQEIYQILTDRQYNFDLGILTLSTDILNMKNITLTENKFSQSFNNQEQKYLFYIQSSFTTIEQLQQSQNQGNCQFYTSQLVKILDSVLINNQGVLGGSLSFDTIKDKVVIKNSNFTSNKALSSGGAIIFSDVNQINVDESYFISNEALIGGAVRIVSSQMKTKEQQLEKEIFECNFQLNKAQIYGNNIGRYPSYMEIFIYEQNKNQILNQQLIQVNKQANIVNITELQSGGLVPINIKLLDDEMNILTIQTELFMSNKYPQAIQNELSQYFLEVTDISSFQDIQSSNSKQQMLDQSTPADIKGEALLTFKHFNQDDKVFSFSTLSISYFPKQSTNSLAIKFTMSNQFPSMIIPLNLTFRECIKGEIFVKSSNLITTCQECQEGTYSLFDPNEQTENMNLQCKKCPLSAKNCSKDQIILEEGYWRINNTSDNILQCNSDFPNICNEADTFSKHGCIQGYIGPLCETCDTSGKLWGGERYTNSFADFQCNKCSQTSYQTLFIGLTFFILLFYLILSIVLFMNSYIYNSTCCYLRLMSVLPFSKSSIKDESTFFMKALVNYLQLSACLFKFQISFLPQVVAVIPSFAGQPVSKIIVSSTCIYKQGLIESYGEEKIRSITQAVIPFIYSIVTLLLLLIFQKLKLLNVGKYHKYLMVNFLFLFFQPDSISFFTNALSCRQIGDFSYNNINLTIFCDDPSYKKFKYSFILPMLLLWTLSPLIILYILIKYHIKKNKMDYCTTKYKYGYFYIEYKKEYSYWEFIRIYYKISIVITVTLFTNLEILMYLLSVIIIFVYLFFTQRVHPFNNKYLLKLEIISCFVLIFNVLFSQINKQHPHSILIVCLGSTHYGYILYILFIILKIKINNSKNCVVVNIKKFLKNLFFQKMFANVSHQQDQNLTTLLRWRKVQKNLLDLRKQNTSKLFLKIEIEECIRRLNNSQKTNIRQQTEQIRQTALSKFSQNDESFSKQNNEQDRFQQKQLERNTTKIKSIFQLEQNSPYASQYKYGLDHKALKFQASETIGTINDQLVLESKDPFNDQEKSECSRSQNQLKFEQTETKTFQAKQNENITFNKLQKSFNKSQESQNEDQEEFNEDITYQEVFQVDYAKKKKSLFKNKNKPYKNQ